MAKKHPLTEAFKALEKVGDTQREISTVGKAFYDETPAFSTVRNDKFGTIVQLNWNKVEKQLNHTELEIFNTLIGKIQEADE
jgi:hypothetical protein